MAEITLQNGWNNAAKWLILHGRWTAELVSRSPDCTATPQNCSKTVGLFVPQNTDAEKNTKNNDRKTDSHGEDRSHGTLADEPQ